jgi:hypothetical protein
MKETDSYYFGCFNDENIFYDFDNDKVIMTNVNVNEKTLPAGEDKPTPEMDLADIGVLLV